MSLFCFGSRLSIVRAVADISLRSARANVTCLRNFTINADGGLPACSRLKKTGHPWAGSCATASPVLKQKHCFINCRFNVTSNSISINLGHPHSKSTFSKLNCSARTSSPQGQKGNWCKSINFARKMSTECDTLPNPSNLIFRQLFDYQSYTYTYLLADKDTKDAILIDPVIELVKRDLHLVEDLGLNLLYAINTHCHADHITGTGRIKEKLPSCKSIISALSGAKADIHINEGDKIKFGNLALEVLSTPGHTSGCVTYVMRNDAGTPVMAFTGDAILIRGCGRTDFQEGDSGTLYDSVHKNILSLPRATRLFPAHDYTGQTVTTVGEELQFNPRLTKTREEFITIMNELNLPYPKAIDKALPANLVCGIVDEGY